jgi:hypothetical protein
MLTPSDIPKFEYDQINFEEIIIKLEEVLAFIRQKKKETKQ